MCTATNKQIVEDVVIDFVKAGRMFTAVDATREAKSQGATERHLHMKGSVHSMQKYMEDNEYERTLIDVGNGNKAFLYHPDHLDPNDYVVAGSLTPKATSAAPVVQVSGKKLRTATPDKDGRICVSGDVLKKANILPGDRVGVTVTSTEAVIGEAKKDSDIVLSVHADGRVRINPTTLKSMGNVSRFQIEIEAHSIHLKSL